MHFRLTYIHLFILKQPTLHSHTSLHFISSFTYISSFQTHILMAAAPKLILLFLFALTACSLADDNDPVPAEPSQVDRWFERNVRPLSSRRASLYPELLAAELKPSVLHVNADGTGQFRRIGDAIRTIPAGNTRRVIILIGPGIYTEKITIDAAKPFVTFYGDPRRMPTIVFGGQSKVYGTKKSATVLVLANYFTAANIIFKNSAPRPVVGRKGEQAAALTIQADMASFYGCHFIGYQDTLCDDLGRHFFMDCYVQGTVDFIFGAGTSIHLRTEAHVIPGDDVAYVTAHWREFSTEKSGYSFIHSSVTGTTGGVAYLGRPWRSFARVTFAYSGLTRVVRPEGWYANATDARTVYFGEYHNLGPRSGTRRRARYYRNLSDTDARIFLTLGYVSGSGWLLPPPTV